MSARRWLAVHRRQVGLVAGSVCVGSAVVWLLVVPSEADDAAGWQRLVLTYGHALVWVMLAMAALLFAFGASGRLIGRVAQLALFVYIAFIAAFVT